jgi:hypothetical protein
MNHYEKTLDWADKQEAENSEIREPLLMRDSDCSVYTFEGHGFKMKVRWSPGEERVLRITTEDFKVSPEAQPVSKYGDLSIFGGGSTRLFIKALTYVLGDILLRMGETPVFGSDVRLLLRFDQVPQ